VWYSCQKHMLRVESFCISSTLNYSRSWESRKDNGMIQTEGCEEYNNREQSCIKMGSLWYQGQYTQVGKTENECEDEMIACFSVNTLNIKVVLWLFGMFWLVQITR
jgi:hypothetical protein